jgi:hypothetical protein
MNSASTRKASTLIRSIALSVFVLASVVLLTPVPALAYPKVRLTNLTKYVASGEVNYPGCRNDRFSGLQPGQTWIPGPARGGCLITWISASLSGGPGVNRYTSSGTSYSEFFISPSGSGYQVFSSHEDPTANRAQPEVVNKPFFNIAHMVTTDAAVDWALSRGANGLEMDMHFHPDGRPWEFRHGGVCDCVCSAFEGGDHVCNLVGCETRAQLEPHLRHIAIKSSQVAMIIIDSKVDKDSLSQAAQRVAGAAVVQLLEQQLFSRGYVGFAVISAPEWNYSAYLLAAADQANKSLYKSQLYVGVDMDNGGTDGARATLQHLWRDVGTSNVVYGSGISACLSGTFYAETMLAGLAEAQGRVRLVDIWTLDKAASMRKYIWLGARGILTNEPGVLAGVATQMNMTLARPGYRP